MFDFATLKILSPKRNPRGQSGWEGFFPYYAGYPEEFATELLRSAGLAKSSRILDPWNGSGTTTFAASRLMLEATGVDINPVMAIVARARTLPSSEADTLVPLARELLAKAERSNASPAATDALGSWFGPTTVDWLRRTERAITESLTSDQTQSSGDFQTISALAATYYVAVFSLCRELASKFQTSNPTWIRVAKEGQRRASAPRQWMADRFMAVIGEMAAALAPHSGSAETAAVELCVADTAVGLNLRHKADFVLTSPPYCTRIDYTAATHLQLAVIDPLLSVRKADLSRKMMGSVRVPTDKIVAADAWGDTCNKFLEAVRRHPSKASGGYYFRTHADYFDKMYRSLGSVSQALRAGGAAVLVVQDSYYKEVHNDLPTMVGEMAFNRGLKLRRREDFRLSKTLAGSHPHSRTYRKSFEAVEAVLCFEKA